MNGNGLKDRQSRRRVQDFAIGDCQKSTVHNCREGEGEGGGGGGGGVGIEVECIIAFLAGHSLKSLSQW